MRDGGTLSPMTDPTHLDDLAGALARVVQVLRPTPRNTLDRLGAYEGAPLDVIFPAPRRVPAVERRTRWRLPGLRSEDLSFASLHEPIEPAFRRYYRARRRRNQTVYARRIRPDSSTSRPRLLYIHGYMQPETFIEEFGLLATMAQVLQMEVVQLQPPEHGRRKSRASRFDGELYWTADVVRSIESLRQTILDARTLLAVMKKESPQPVGIAGLSLGGALTAALTCLEPGFAFSAPFIAHMDLGALVADAPVLGAMREDLLRFGWTPRDFGAFTTRMGWDALAPVVPKERICLFGARDDHFFRAKVLRAMWRRWDQPKIHWYPTSHMGFIAHLPDAVTRLRTFVDGLELDAETPRRPKRAKPGAPHDNGPPVLTLIGCRHRIGKRSVPRPFRSSSSSRAAPRWNSRGWRRAGKCSRPRVAATDIPSWCCPDCWRATSRRSRSGASCAASATRRAAGAWASMSGPRTRCAAGSTTC